MKTNIFLKIDWTSKLVDLLIVIVGISIAFKLNTWNESKKASNEMIEYLASFHEENTYNKNTLTSALEYSLSIKTDIDSLKVILASEDYDNPNTKIYAASMMSLSNFIPLTTTMDNITASGEFGLIKNPELRKKIIDTYKSYRNTLKVDEILTDYVDKYLTPYFFENVRFSDFNPIGEDFIDNPRFENLVFGYEVLLNQQIRGYEDAIQQINTLLSAID